jgi:hypothetical protein
VGEPHLHVLLLLNDADKPAGFGVLDGFSADYPN